MNDIVMPKLSDTMTEGRVVSWKKQAGDQVRRGEVLAEVETDKANMELEAFTSGVLLEIKVPAGEMAQVGTVIAVIGTAEEKAGYAQKGREPQPQEASGAGAQPAPEAQPAQEEQAAQAAQPAQEAAQVPSSEKTGRSEAPAETQAPAAAQELTSDEAPAAAQAQEKAMPQSAAGEPTAPAPPPQQPPVGKGPGGSPVASGSGGPHLERAAPVVRRRARELGLDLGQIKGSGPDGRILLQDLEREQPGAPPSAPSSAAQEGAAPTPPVAQPGPGETVPFSRLRGAVAKTVAESWRTIPHFSVTADIFMDDAETVRRQLKASSIAVSLNDIIVKAAALALAKFPRLNASLANDAIVQHPSVNIGVAVGVPDGVLMPVIRDCEQLPLREIAEAGRQLVERSRNGAVTEQDLSGGTFSVSNLGMYGVSQFNAVIFPNQAAVLAVGAVSDAVVARSGNPVCVRLMKVTLCADHRIVDGAYAAEFLVELKAILENPVRLLV